MDKFKQILKVLKNERECIKRQAGTTKDGYYVSLCDRNCDKCDLCLPDTEILEVYDFLINGYEMLQNEGAESYTIKCKEPLSDTKLGILKGNLCDTESFTASFEPFPLPEGMITTMPDTLYKVTETPSEIRVEPTPIERLKAPFERVKENLNKAFGIKQPGKVMAEFWQKGKTE